nr:ORF1 [Torque teno mini virus 4]
MPYWYRNWRSPWWKRRRKTFWRRRTRGYFRKRRYRRRRVRRKLKTINLKQWQPSTIHRVTVKGLYCLLIAHHKRINKNWGQYQGTVVAEGLPGGGGYSILRFNLESLFSEHELVRNVWTKSNKHLPLFRYNGCEIKVYRPEHTDLVIRFQTCYPMSASQFLYLGCQPGIMMMSKHSHIIPSLKTKPYGKHYKKFRLPPPQQMQNKWYFQSQEAKTGLLLIQSAACSLNQYYISQYAESDTITLYTLNTKIITNLNFKNFPQTTGYQPNPNMYFWALPNGDEKYKNLIYLANTIEYQEGKTINSMASTKWSEKKTQYAASRANWGNLFCEKYMHKKVKMYFTKQHFSLALQNINNGEEQIQGSSGFTELTQELFFMIRYNPRNDSGQNAQIYLKSNWKENENLEPPDDENLKATGFPNWLGCWGFVDYEIKLGKVTQVPTHYIVIMISEFFTPKLQYYLLVDKYFTEGDSEYLQGRTGWENLNWYPMITHQDDSLNTLALSGPGTPKLGPIKSAECKIEYKFHLKVGGCAAPMEKVADPSNQPTFPVPDKLIDSNSLQNPTTPIESFLWQFDERRNQITAKAAERIKKDFGLTDSLFTDSTTTGTEVPVHKTFPEKDLSSEEEEAQEQTLFEQLQQHRLHQQQLRQRIKLLLNKLQNST